MTMTRPIMLAQDLFRTVGELGRMATVGCLTVTLLSGSVQAMPQVPMELDDDSQPAEFVSHHELDLGDRVLRYTATASETHVDIGDESRVSIFSIAYTLDEKEPSFERPISFLFNGGPGSSSIWLHLGAFAPRRVVVPSDGTDAGAAPFELRDNPLTLLAVSDLVFIDPIGTGYSRALGESENEEFWGMDEDAESLTDFVRIWLTERGRWNSPKYIIGESYGTIRAAAMLELMQSPFTGMAPNGVVLIAPALDTQTLFFLPGNLLPYVLFLPSYAATAWYHDALPSRPAQLSTFLDEVAEFAVEDFASALLKGSSLDESVREVLLNKLTSYTGLSRDYIDRADLRVNSSRFRKELLRDRGQTVGRLDSRYLGEETDLLDDVVARDPSSIGIEDAFTSATHLYLRDELGVTIPRKYEVLNLRANSLWKRPENGTAFFAGHVNVLPSLASAAAENPALRIFVAAGLYDLATPYYSARYMVDQSGIDSGRITLRAYEAGHMMYNHRSSYEQLSQDVRDFISAGSTHQVAAGDSKG